MIHFSHSHNKTPDYEHSLPKFQSSSIAWFRATITSKYFRRTNTCWERISLSVAKSIQVITVANQSEGKYHQDDSTWKNAYSPKHGYTRVTKWRSVLPLIPNGAEVNVSFLVRPITNRTKLKAERSQITMIEKPPLISRYFLLNMWVKVLVFHNYILLNYF